MYKIDISFKAFAKLHKSSNSVIPAKAGIQYYQIFPRFPRINYGAGSVKPGMTNKGVIQMSPFMAQMRGLICLVYTFVFLSIAGTANTGLAREADKKGAPTTGQSSNEVRSARKVKPEWQMPDFYPADGFDGMGQIDDISYRDGLVVINDTGLKVSPSAEYHTPTNKYASGALFKQGDEVGYILDSDGTIISIWLIVIKK